MPKKYKYVKNFTYDGKRYRVYGDTLDEVYEKKANKIRDMKDGKVTVSNGMTVENWTKICVETYKTNMKDESRQNMMYRINKNIISEIGYMRLKDVTPLHCQKIMNNQSGRSKGHIRDLSHELKFIFEKARKNHLILENPADDIILPAYEDKKRRSITADERKHLLIVASKFNQFRLFLLMLYCGCRPAEAVKSLGSDISIVKDRPILHIRGTKTHNSDRYVPIPQDFYNQIKDTDSDAPIAVTQNGMKFNESSYKRTVKRLRREINISMGCKVYRNQLIEPLPLADDFVPYCLRHTYCTDLQRNGVDIRVAQKLMGHASIETTADIYTHLDILDILDGVPDV